MMKSTRCSLTTIINKSTLPTNRLGKILSPCVLEPVTAVKHPRPVYGEDETLQNFQTLAVSYSMLVVAHIAVALGIPCTEVPEEVLGSTSSRSATERSAAPVDLSDIPKYQLLGSGSFGNVWRVNWQGACCALKTFTHHQESIEGRIALELVHPNIVTTLAHQTTSTEGDKKMTHILMEACMKTLEDGIKEKIFTCPGTGQLDWEKIRKMLVNLAKGLAYVHSRGYVHLDLKPANTFLCLESDKELIAKIGDFGLSLELKGEKEVKVERPGTIMISPPEAFEKSTASVKSDVYSFGILVWMLVTAKIPYDGMDFDDVIDFITEGIRPTIDPSWPAWVKSLMQDCWATDPSLRPFAWELVTSLEMAPKRTCPPRGPPPGFGRHKLPPPPGFGPGPFRKPDPTTDPANSGILAIMPERPPGF